ncbi:hypothetical protein F444_18709 [Phytophthora nicotianae P1976]|uniref:Uncharacterized protein n=1 Tax=Phytophthora nicotianae P1976 TaxID=1317066 RepID=A0A080ZAG9_PHYNI|nr:hypothetical protein F444_18709 [Phytophthora nicotianae P1976]
MVAERQRFEISSRCHLLDRIHNVVMDTEVPCAVPPATACQHCHFAEVRQTERDVPAPLQDLRSQLEKPDAARAGSRNASAGIMITLGSGPRTFPQFPQWHAWGSSAASMYL